MGASLLLMVLLQSQTPTAEAAAGLALRGDLDASERIVDARLSQKPEDAAALFVRACVKLERGNLEEAKAAISRLAAVAPKAPEVAVLESLAARRAVGAHTPWLAEFLVAIQTSAGKDLSHPLLAKDSEDPSTRREIPPEALVSLSSQEVFLIHFAQHKPSIPSDLVLEAERVTSVEASLPVSLAVLDLLTRNALPSAVKESAHAAAARLERRLASEHPEDLLRRIGAILAGTSEEAALTEAEVAALERAIREGATFLEFRFLFEAFRAALQKVDPTPAGQAAFEAACGPYPFPEFVKLLRRARTSEASPDLRLRKRVGEVSAEVARAMVKQPYLINLAQARVLMQEAAKLTVDPAVTEEATSLGERVTKLRGTHDTQSLIGEFAIPSLQAEILDAILSNEIGYLGSVSSS